MEVKFTVLTQFCYSSWSKEQTAYDKKTIIINVEYFVYFKTLEAKNIQKQSR